jgi:uncharacterized membrane protein (DUF2068 family)
LEKAPPHHRLPKSLALRSIVAYKTTKAAIEFGLALLLIVLLPFGLPGWVAILSLKLKHRFVQAWSIHLADLIVRSTTRRRIDLTIGALILDGVLTGVEAWSLERRFWWAPWLVVFASGSLLPFEILEWNRHRHLMRAAMFVVNLAVVLYLGRQAWHEHRVRQAERAAEEVTPSPPP